MFDRKCKIIFINHGSTIFTDQKRLYDNDDYPPLNENGKNEIEKLSEWLKLTNPNVDIIYTSSALRAIQSARIIAKSYKIDFDIVDNMYERRPGIWGGLTFKIIEEKYPEMLEQYHKNPSNFWPEGGETTNSLRERTKKVIDNLVAHNQKKSLIVATHAGIIQSAIALALNIPPEYQARIYIPNGSATQINYYKEWSSLVYSANKPL